MFVRMALIGAVAAIAVALVPSVQAGTPSDAHGRQALVATLQDAHDRSLPSSDAWSATGTRGVDVVPAADRYQDHPGAVPLERPTVVAGPGGFDWGDAAIGAISGMGFALLLAGVVFLTLGQRTRARIAMH